jgi:hypothetical protein
MPHIWRCTKSWVLYSTQNPPQHPSSLATPFPVQMPLPHCQQSSNDIRLYKLQILKKLHKYMYVCMWFSSGALTRPFINWKVSWQWIQHARYDTNLSTWPALTFCAVNRQRRNMLVPLVLLVGVLLYEGMPLILEQDSGYSTVSKWRRLREVLRRVKYGCAQDVTT